MTARPLQKHMEKQSVLNTCLDSLASEKSKYHKGKIPPIIEARVVELVEENIKVDIEKQQQTSEDFHDNLG